MPGLPCGGAERFVVDLANELSKYNDVYILTFRDGKDADFYRPQISERVHQIIYRGNYSFFSKLWQFIVVARLIVKIRPEIVHTHLIAIPYAIIPSLLMSNLKVLYTIHSLASKDTKAKIPAKMRKLLLKKWFRGITISQQCEKSFKEFYGYGSYGLIENGCRELMLSNQIDSVKKEIRNLCPSDKSIVYICVARIMREKNHLMLIQAFNYLINRGEDVVLLMIGSYDDRSVLKQSLDQVICDTNRIHFLGTRTNIPDYLACSDYFCLTSIWEGLPISLIEAGMMGCYPVCTPAGGIVDVVRDDRWGVLSKDFSKDSYVEAIDLAKKKKVNKQELIDLYKSEYSIANCAKKYMEVYNE